MGCRGTRRRTGVPLICDRLIAAVVIRLCVHMLGSFGSAFLTVVVAPLEDKVLVRASAVRFFGSILMVQYKKHAFLVVSSIGISNQNHFGFCRESISFPAVMMMQYGFRACLFTVPRVEMESGRLGADVLYVGRVIDWDPSMPTSWWFNLCRRKLDEREDVWKDCML